MRTIGFRAEKDRIRWAVVSDGRPPVVEEHGVIAAPATYDGDDKRLAYLRERVREAVGRHQVGAAGIKYPEVYGRGSGNTSSMDARLRIEGVIVEAVASTNTPIFTGGFQSVGRQMKSKKPKDYIAPQSDDVRGVVFKMKDEKHRDAVLVAVAALEAHRGSAG